MQSVSGNCEDVKHANEEIIIRTQAPYVNPLLSTKTTLFDSECLGYELSSTDLFRVTNDDRIYNFSKVYDNMRNLSTCSGVKSTYLLMSNSFYCNQDYIVSSYKDFFKGVNAGSFGLPADDTVSTDTIPIESQDVYIKLRKDLNLDVGYDSRNNFFSVVLGLPFNNINFLYGVQYSYKIPSGGLHLGVGGGIYVLNFNTTITKSVDSNGGGDELLEASIRDSSEFDAVFMLTYGFWYAHRLSKRLWLYNYAHVGFSGSMKKEKSDLPFVGNFGVYASYFLTKRISADLGLSALTAESTDATVLANLRFVFAF